MKNKGELPPEHIKSLRIDDKDVPGWFESLWKEGFSEEEIADILSPLSETYFKKAKGKELADGVLEKLEGNLRGKYGRVLKPEERESLRNYIAERFK